MPEQVLRDVPASAVSRLLRECLRAAIQAPSIHNTQPWLFRLRTGALDVLADRRRQLRALDPDGRALHVSIGAALLNLQVALHARGWASRLLLLPDPGQRDLCATVTITRSTPPSPLGRALAAAIGRRHSNRRPFAPVPVPDADLTALVAAAMAEDASLLVPDPSTRQGVLALVRAADRQQRSDGRYRTELAAWTFPVRGQADGVPPSCSGPRPDQARVPLRDFGLVHDGHRKSARFERAPTIAVLYSRGDEPADWLRAGMALQRVLLTATARGLATTLMTQPVEIPSLRAHLVAPHEPRIAQAVLRLGYARPVPATPRRTVASVLLDA
ncbi:MAG: nitroreductase family protein [Micromonosporaceae bacterium]|jgi:nitroreductase|nr:nitroreductase family protein [Micromonosporaceae bacterium]